MGDDIKLRVSKIEKSFPGVKALDKIDFTVRKGTVHALCGENGAGKSTLMKIINGIYKPDAGEIFVDEKSVKIKDPIMARSLGIAMIAQELNYVPEMSVEENIFLGRLPVDGMGRVKWREVREKTERLLKEEHLPYKATDKLKTLTTSDIQMLEILKAISNDASIVVMDEPTSSITQKEVELLFKKIALLKAKGCAIVYISHKMDEVFRIADDITVFRDGTVVKSMRAEDTNIDEVIALMVGRRMENVYPKENIEIGEPLLEVKDLKSGQLFEDVTFHVGKGEIVGFAGLVGAGRTEVMRCLFGLDPIDGGTVKVHGKEIKIKRVADATKAGMVMLSGGTQQKVLLAKWMMRDAEVLILDEPTRGIDVGAKFEIYKLMTEVAQAGKAVVMVSSELPELIGMCDRIYVMNQGHIAGELKREEFSQEAIMVYATGTHSIIQE